MRTTFLVGRVNRKGAEMVVAESMKATPFPGPWTLKALVRPSSGTAAPVSHPSCTNLRVH